MKNNFLEITIEGVEYLAFRKHKEEKPEIPVEPLRMATLKRIIDRGEQTLGILMMFIDSKQKGSLTTLELPWKDNQFKISCIPKGIYNCIVYESPTKGTVYLLENVQDRSMIEIHVGNYNRDIEGCILVGEHFTDIDGDCLTDVTNSRSALDTLFKVFEGKPFTLVIK